MKTELELLKKLMGIADEINVNHKEIIDAQETWIRELTDFFTDWRRFK